MDFQILVVMTFIKNHGFVNQVDNVNSLIVTQIRHLFFGQKYVQSEAYKLDAPYYDMDDMMTLYMIGDYRFDGYCHNVTEYENTYTSNSSNSTLDVSDTIVVNTAAWCDVEFSEFLQNQGARGVILAQNIEAANVSTNTSYISIVDTSLNDLITTEIPLRLKTILSLQHQQQCQHKYQQLILKTQTYLEFIYQYEWSKTIVDVTLSPQVAPHGANLENRKYKMKANLVRCDSLSPTMSPTQIPTQDSKSKRGRKTKRKITSTRKRNEYENEKETFKIY